MRLISISIGNETVIGHYDTVVFMYLTHSNLSYNDIKMYQEFLIEPIEI